MTMLSNWIQSKTASFSQYFLGLSGTGSSIDSPPLHERASRHLLPGRDASVGLARSDERLLEYAPCLPETPRLLR